MAEQSFSYCPNCGSERHSRFCPNCGQNDRNYLRSLIPVLWEITREVFEIDGRLFKSLRLLITRPGQLSTEFSENRRAQYMSPFRMYLFVSILFVFTLSLTAEIGAPEHTVIAEAEGDVVLDDDHLELFKSYLTPAQGVKVDGLVARTDSMARVIVIESANSFAEQSKEELEEVGELDRFFMGQLVDALDNPEVALAKLMDNLPIALFVLLPAYAVLLQLFYWRSGRFYVEHLIFGVYLHTLAFLLFTLLMVLPESDEAGLLSAAETVLQLGFFVYYFMALKKYYGQGAVITTFKFGALLFSYSVLLIPGLLIVMAATFVFL